MGEQVSPLAPSASPHHLAEPLHRVSQFGPDYAGVLGPWREWNASFDVNDTRAEEAGLQALRDLTACNYANVTSVRMCSWRTYGSMAGAGLLLRGEPGLVDQGATLDIADDL